MIIIEATSDHIFHTKPINSSPPPPALKCSVPYLYQISPEPEVGNLKFRKKRRKRVYIQGIHTKLGSHLSNIVFCNPTFRIQGWRVYTLALKH